MIAIANRMAGDKLAILPPRESPYVLRAAYELVEDGCRIELVLQWSGSHLVFLADEDTDALGFELRSGEFEPVDEHRMIGDDLTSNEVEVLNELVNGPRSKQQLGVRAKLMGAATRPGFGKQGGGLLRRGSVTSKRVGREVEYELTAKGRLAVLLGKECSWTWAAWNQQGYSDSVILSFDGVVPNVLLHVIASSIEVFSLTHMPNTQPEENRT